MFRDIVEVVQYEDSCNRVRSDIGCTEEEIEAAYVRNLQRRRELEDILQKFYEEIPRIAA
jgi:hypothetical protein